MRRACDQAVAVIEGFAVTTAQVYFGLGGVMRGQDSMVLGIVFGLSAVPSANNFLWGNNIVSAGGVMVWSSAAAAFGCTKFDGGGVGRTSPTRTLVAADIPFLHAALFDCDGATVKQYFDRALVGGSTACVGYTLPNIANQMTLGAGSNVGTPSTPAVSLYAAGAVLVEGASGFSLAQAQAWFDQVKSSYARDLDPSFLGGTHYVFNARDVVPGGTEDQLALGLPVSPMPDQMDNDRGLFRGTRTITTLKSRVIRENLAWGW